MRLCVLTEQKVNKPSGVKAEHTAAFGGVLKWQGRYFWDEISASFPDTDI